MPGPVCFWSSSLDRPQSSASGLPGQGDRAAIASVERETFPIARLQTMRANVLLINRAKWQTAAPAPARPMRGNGEPDGLGPRCDPCRLWPPLHPGDRRRAPARTCMISMTPPRCSTFPITGARSTRDRACRSRGVFAEEPEPRPSWIAPKEKWPPPVRHGARPDERAVTACDSPARPGQNGLPSSKGSRSVARFSNRVMFFRKVSLSRRSRRCGSWRRQLGDAGLVVGS